MSNSFRFKNLLTPLILLGLCATAQASALDRVRARGELLWGADAGGGAPYVFPNPKNPSQLIGFEQDLAERIAQTLGVKARHVQNTWDNLIPTLQRGDFDMAMNGLEILPERASHVLFSRPYYVYTEQLVVRKNETRIRSLQDLSGKKAGTLSGTAAQAMLEAVPGAQVKLYPSQVEPYEDLEFGRIDAVLLDLPIAAYYAKPNPRLRYEGAPVGEGYYGIAFRKEDSDLKLAVDDVLDKLLRTGELRRIYEKWDIWNPAQERLAGLGESAPALEDSETARLYTLLPPLLRGAATTLWLSVSSMALAVSLGLLLTFSRLYGPAPLRFLAAAYVEVYRGTPLLIQLYLLYYGLPNLGITMSPVLAAFLGLGMNYAAYESEIYRGGIRSVPKGQMEAALSLGMSRVMAVRRIILPQALRVTLPPVTNDFIALFKDSSIVSVITMVELTKTYSVLSLSTLRFMELGLVTALLYFAMSYPLSLLARHLEKRTGTGRDRHDHR